MEQPPSYWADAARRARRPSLAPRIAAVVSDVPASPETFDEQAHAWFLHLNKALRFPFDARVCRGAVDFKRGDRLQALALAGHDEWSGVIVHYKHGKRKGEIPLCRLEAVGRQSEAAQWLDAYRLWRDTAIDADIDDMADDGFSEPDDPGAADDWLDEIRAMASAKPPASLLTAASPPPLFPPAGAKDTPSARDSAVAPPAAPGRKPPPAAADSALPAADSGILEPEPPVAGEDVAGGPPPTTSTPDAMPAVEEAPPPAGEPPAPLPVDSGAPDHAADLSVPGAASPEWSATPLSGDPPLRESAFVLPTTSPAADSEEPAIKPATARLVATSAPDAARVPPVPADAAGRDPFADALLALDRMHRGREAEIGELRRERAEQARKSEEEAARLRERLASATTEAEALRSRVAELEHEARVFCDLADDAKRDRDFHLAEHRKLRTRAESLAAQLADRNGQPDGGALPFPTAYKDVPAWVEEHLAGRLLLLPRAVRGLAEAQFLDIGLVCRALLLLAHEYRGMKRGELPRSAFDAKLEELRLRCSQAITPTRAGEEGDEYFVAYPPGTLKRRFLEQHLRNNATTRYPPRCLAIYFLWDEILEQVAVGWLPGHLDIRSS